MTEDSKEYVPRGQCPYCLGLLYSCSDEEIAENLRIHVELAHPHVEIKLRRVPVS